MKWSKISLLILFVVTLHGSTNCVQKTKEGKSMKLSRDRILESAKGEAIRRGYDVNKFNLIEDENNEKWTQSWAFTLKYNPHLSDPTKNKDFTAVYFKPKAMQLGGDLWVLIDNVTGEVIFALPGK